MPARRDSRSSGLQFNMTPMIDVTFLLIIFFMLVSQITSAENVEMELPDPTRSQAKEVRLKDRVIVNVVYTGPQDPPAYKLGALSVETLEELGAGLAEEKVKNPDVQVVLRADRRLHYAAVRAVMEVIAQQQIPLMNIAAEQYQEEVPIVGKTVR